MHAKLCGYFAAFNLNLLLLIAALWLYGWGPAYAWVYVLSSVPIFLAIAAICKESLLTREHKARAIAIGFILALAIGHLAHVGIVRPVTVYDWISLTEGTLLVWAGIVLGFSAAYIKRWDLAIILAIMWLAQALFSFGYVLHFDWPEWLEANWYVPQSICIVGFSLIAWRVRAKLHSRPLAAHLQ
jgi:hypothetical protein